MPIYEKHSALPQPAETVFDWHARPGAFERLTPPWEPVEIVARRGTIRDGDELHLRMGGFPFHSRWVARHEGFVEGRRFVDVMVKGPFARWRHEHLVEPREGASHMVDRVDYGLPLAPLSSWVAGRMVRRRLERMFTYRHATLRDDLGRHARHAARDRLRVAVTGASGLVGGALVPFLTTGGHRVAPLVRDRDAARDGAIHWSPSEGILDAQALEGVDAVVHLAGAGVADARWSDARKREILESRTKGTRLVAEAMARLDRGPRVLVCASANGFYGSRGDEIVDHRSVRGDGFLADVVEAWERAADPAREAGIRVVHLRIGIVLAQQGGALAKMLPAFRLGGGGPLGDGRQWMSWIALDDVVGAVHEALFDDRYAGPIDLVAPEPVRQGDFARTLGRVLGRPAVVPAPAFALEAVFGREFARETVLASTRSVPTRLRELGFAWAHPDLEGALRHLLGRARPSGG